MIRVENVEERSAGPVGETTGRKRVAVRNRRGRGRRRRNIAEREMGLRMGVSKIRAEDFELSIRQLELIASL